MNTIVGFLKNVAFELKRKNKVAAKAIDDVFKAKMECDGFGYDACDGILQLPNSEKNAANPKKSLYLADNGDLYFGTTEQARTYRKTGVNAGTKLN